MKQVAQILTEEFGEPSSDYLMLGARNQAAGNLPDKVKTLAFTLGLWYTDAEEEQLLRAANILIEATDAL